MSVSVEERCAFFPGHNSAITLDCVTEISQFYGGALDAIGGAVRSTYVIIRRCWEQRISALHAE
jgi:hypothetical protein